MLASCLLKWTIGAMKFLLIILALVVLTPNNARAITGNFQLGKRMLGEKVKPCRNIYSWVLLSRHVSSSIQTRDSLSLFVSARNVRVRPCIVSLNWAPLTIILCHTTGRWFFVMRRWTDERDHTRIGVYCEWIHYLKAFTSLQATRAVHRISDAARALGCSSLAEDTWGPESSGGKWNRTDAQKESSLQTRVEPNLLLSAISCE